MAVKNNLRNKMYKKTHNMIRLKTYENIFLASKNLTLR